MIPYSSKAPLPEWMADRLEDSPHSWREVLAYAAARRDFTAGAALRGAATVKLKTIAARTGYDERTVRRAFDGLERLGIIRRVRRGVYAKSYLVATEPYVFPHAHPTPATAPAAEVQPPLMLAMPEQKADTKPDRKADTEADIDLGSGQESGHESGQNVRSKVDILSGLYQEKTYPVPPSIPPTSAADAGAPARTDGNQGTNERTDYAVGRLRDRVGVWPRQQLRARQLVAAALEAGWSIDGLVDELRASTSSSVIRDRGAVVLSNLIELAATRPPGAPRSSEQAEVVELPVGDGTRGAAAARAALAAARKAGPGSKGAGNDRRGRRMVAERPTGYRVVL